MSAKVHATSVAATSRKSVVALSSKRATMLLHACGRCVHQAPAMGREMQFHIPPPRRRQPTAAAVVSLALATALVTAAAGLARETWPVGEIGFANGVPRRSSATGLLLALGMASGAGANEAQAAFEPFKWNFLYTDDHAAAELEPPKRTGLRPAELASVLRRDLTDRRYILTGKLTPEIFEDNCRFVDPNNAVDGLARYRQALALLFDPEDSHLEVQDVQVSQGDRTIQADYVASGTLKLPWRPRIAPWSGHIVYTLNSDGLIVSQVDAWNITRFDAIRQTFTPR